MEHDSIRDRVEEIHSHYFEDSKNAAYKQAYQELHSQLEQPDVEPEDLQQSVSDYIDATEEAMREMDLDPELEQEAHLRAEVSNLESQVQELSKPDLNHLDPDGADLGVDGDDLGQTPAGYGY